MEKKFDKKVYDRKFSAAQRQNKIKKQFKVDLNNQEFDEIDSILKKINITKTDFLKKAIKDFKMKEVFQMEKEVKNYNLIKDYHIIVESADNLIEIKEVLSNYNKLEDYVIYDENMEFVMSAIELKKTNVAY